MTDDQKSKKSREKGGAQPVLDDELIALVDTLPPPSEFAQRFLETVPQAGSIKIYLKEIGRFPVLSESEELDLVKTIQARPDPKTRKKLNEANIRLVAWIAKEYADGETALSDLIHEGTLGLARSVDSYEVDSGVSFRLHAAKWIRQAVSEALAYETSASRVPEFLKEKIESIKPVSQRLMSEMGREPTREEVAEELGFSVDELDRLVKLVGVAPEPEGAGEEGEENADDVELEDDYYENQDYD
jgi:RNA polymerase primary sigma factor